ncbi:hypothetical protein EVAR_75828_1 [Eumeta japonica]|uniref:Uncharacterized protein n=1 Tax=Eumeta variegata TaxID=151549 RepID=A0A4C1TD74_EUMVA|nr:hypothetical protein EVAR_75828_1 [Eumeta japonica]
MCAGTAAGIVGRARLRARPPPPPPPPALAPPAARARRLPPAARALARRPPRVASYVPHGHVARRCARLHRSFRPLRELTLISLRNNIASPVFLTYRDK